MRFHLPPVYDIREVSTPLSESVGWGLQLCNIPAIHASGITGEGVVIVYVDTGIDATHVDLQGAVLDARDFTGSPILWRDRQKHGTHTFGTALARHNAGGILGVSPGAQGIMAKGLGDDGSGTGEQVAAAIRWGVDRALQASRAVILNMSLGSNFDDEEIKAALLYAISKGVIPVLAAGNDGGAPDIDDVGFPARLDLSPAIASYRRDGKLSDFSSTGPSVDVACPGEIITSTVPGGGYMQMSGTSMATPFAAGVLALFLEALTKAGKPLPTAGEATTLMYQACDDKGPPGRDWGYGFGSLNAAKLIDAARKPLPAPYVPPPDKPPAISIPALPWLGGVVKWLQTLPLTIHTPAQAGDLIGISLKK